MDLNYFRNRIAEVLVNLSAEERETLMEMTLVCMMQELRNKGHIELAEKLAKMMEEG